MTPRWIGLLFVCLLSAATSSTFAVPQQPESDASQTAAREIARIAIIDLRSVNSPTAADYNAAMIILGLAHELDPENTTIIRRLIEAAHGAGNTDAVLEHTRALLMKDPTDAVATLRLISATIGRDHDTVESRLAAYERYISNTSLDASIRSRLALDEALLLRERGDDKGFKDKLGQSISLDSTHKEAAALAATFFAERVANDPAGRLDLLVNLLKADPVDPNIHLSIARELTIAGAYRAALRFHTNALTISSLISKPGDGAVVENTVLRWYSDGPAQVVKGLGDSLASERDKAARVIRSMIEARRPTDDATKPEDVYFPAAIGTVYLLAADAAGDRAALAGGMRDYSAQTEKLITGFRNPRSRGNMTDQQVARVIQEALAQLNTIRLWLDIDTEKYQANPDAIRGIRAGLPEVADVLDALWELRAGRPDEAISRCAPLLPGRLARVTTGLALEKRGDTAAAIDMYRALVEAEPLTPGAAWARSRIKSLGGEPTSPKAPELERRVSDPIVPAWIDQMVVSPDHFLRLTATVPVVAADATTDVPIHITITNQSSIPLSLGADRPLNSRLLLVPKMEHVDLEGLLRPEVLDLDRKFRLLPRETIEADLWTTPGQTGWFIDGMANRNLRVRWKVIQGFISEENAGFKPGPMCLTTETNAFVLHPLAASSLSSTELAAAIAGAPIESLRRLASVTRSHVLQPLIHPDPPLPDPPAPRKGQPALPKIVIPPMDLKPAAGAFTLRYPQLSPAHRAMILAIVPHSKLAPDLAALDAAARADQDPLIRCVFLSTRISDPKDEYLAAAAQSEDPRVRQVAEAVTARLASPSRFYARLTPQDLRPSAAPPANPPAAPPAPTPAPPAATPPSDSSPTPERAPR